jgi:TRAP-type uncharacterized transport system fused permease subunit
MWLFLGFLLGAGLILLVLLVRSRKLAITWYEWLLVVAGLALLLYAFQNYRTSIVELEPKAAGLLLMIFGLMGILLLAIAGLLVWWQRFRKLRAQIAPKVSTD